ncbi:DUF2789 domain-containing protein [Porticoccus sp.]|uniref:DUF2789 domain-containing protein n=1 Tax=Porticoccus sp. TaxID=2024853 RepID=UPI003F69D0B4
MDTSIRTLSTLFDQLGLPSTAAAIELFIALHQALPPETRLAEAPFWNEAQRVFLEEAIFEDSDWAELVDQLDSRFRI